MPRVFCVRRPWDTKNDNLEFVEESLTKEKDLSNSLRNDSLLDKLVDELAKGKAMEKIKRTNKGGKAAYYTPTENAV